MVAVLEMTNQSDEILRILSDHGRSMRKSDLRRQTDLRMYEISSILDELEMEGKIRMDGTIISLI
jgi:DNA-binding IclR family transcriptional regulator